jgi:hypothetical protein
MKKEVMENRRADGELRRLPVLKFTGGNVGEFLDKFPRIAKYWQVWKHLSTDKIPKMRNLIELEEWWNRENKALEIFKDHVLNDVWDIIYENGYTARNVFSMFSSIFLTSGLKFKIEKNLNFQYIIFPKKLYSNPLDFISPNIIKSGEVSISEVKHTPYVANEGRIAHENAGKPIEVKSKVECEIIEENITKRVSSDFSKKAASTKFIKKLVQKKEEVVNDKQLGDIVTNNFDILDEN